MSATAVAPPARFDAAKLVAWPRLRFALIAALPFGLLLAIGSETSTPAWIVRAFVVALATVLLYGACEQFPAAPPAGIARWVWQLIGVAVGVVAGALAAYWLTTGELQFWHDRLRVVGLVKLVFTGLLFAPWLALGAMVRQREALAREQMLGFQLERSEFRRQALDARLRLLQAQVQPHFLFNTLANVRALVRTGSPQAPLVLDSLIAYLRAAMPRLDEQSTTLAEELRLVRAYLELMQMRMPDRLRWTVQDDDLAAAAVRCPPAAVLTLVENAVRHGIDPSEDGGSIVVSAALNDGRCNVRVIDTGVGLQQASQGSQGTGLSALRERLQLAFGGDARLAVTEIAPHGVCAELSFPVEPARQ
ncbi:MAG: histidine kinase [Proteobacteria bacterium]|nr:histidine kinase [Pseudomonadota bacterium]